MNEQKRIHILGASGSGTTTLGKHLAKALDCVFVDADDIFWETTEPPFTVKRPVSQRRAALEEKLGSGSWVLAGSVTGWGDFLKTKFTHVLFLKLSPTIRMERIVAREKERYGDRIHPGGDMEKIHRDFLEWAAKYDAGGMDVRSLVLHEHWMRSLPCPVLRLDAILPTAVQAEVALDFLNSPAPTFTVESLKGRDAAPMVDPFFASLGRPTTARSSDYFFVALAGKEVLGVVRYCVEEGTHMLRGMLIAERARRQGVGMALLKAFDFHLRKLHIAPVFCLPHAHLASFYGAIGFQQVPDKEAPAFLRERVALYRENQMPDVIVMRRG
jgi:adenylate kinase family enzyme/N-acetylglutamate synthase-like GNAT family acetyltransferase